MRVLWFGLLRQVLTCSAIVLKLSLNLLLTTTLNPNCQLNCIPGYPAEEARGQVGPPGLLGEGLLGPRDGPGMMGRLVAGVAAAAAPTAVPVAPGRDRG